VNNRHHLHSNPLSLIGYCSPSGVHRFDHSLAANNPFGNRLIIKPKCRLYVLVAGNQASGLKRSRTEHFAMSKSEQTGPRSVSTTPDEVRRRQVTTNLMPPSQQTKFTTKGNSLPLIDGDRKVIRFRSYSAAFRQKSGLRTWDRTGESEVIRFRSRAHASRPEPEPRRWNATGKSSIENIDAYEYPSESDDDYRHRMLQNILATVVLIVLMIAGYWVVNALATVK
jgi:hypothetical protein